MAVMYVSLQYPGNVSYTFSIFTYTNIFESGFVRSSPLEDTYILQRPPRAYQVVEVVGDALYALPHDVGDILHSRQRDHLDHLSLGPMTLRQCRLRFDVTHVPPYSLP